MEVVIRLGGLVMAVVIIFQVSLVKSNEVHQVKGHNVTITDDDLAIIDKCLKSMELKSIGEMTSAKLPCFLKCLMDSFGMLNQFGKPDRENILKAYEAEHIPKDVSDLCIKDLGKCLDDFGEKITPDEPNCASYGPLAMCMIDSVDFVCYTV